MLPLPRKRTWASPVSWPGRCSVVGSVGEGRLAVGWVLEGKVGPGLRLRCPISYTPLAQLMTPWVASYASAYAAIKESGRTRITVFYVRLFWKKNISLK